MKDNALISVRGLEKSFGKDIQVLKGIDIDIFKGDVVVVLGPSGSGKSTFLRCLNRLEEPTGGLFGLLRKKPAVVEISVPDLAGSADIAKEAARVVSEAFLDMEVPTK